MTPLFETFIAPARRTPQIWRLLLGLLLCIAVHALVTALVFVAGWILLTDADDPIWLMTLANAQSVDAILLLLATFTGMALGPMIAVRVLHRRPSASLFGPGARTLRHFMMAAGLSGGILALSVIIAMTATDLLPGLPLPTWLSILPLLLAGILVQTGAEELLFRGYLQQQLAARFRSPVIWMLLPALLFGAVHYNPAGAGENAWLVVATAALFGLMAADLTARTGSLGAAWGFHFANNFLAIGVIGTQGSLTGAALFLTEHSLSDQDAIQQTLPVDVAVMVLIWFVLRRCLGR